MPTLNLSDVLIRLTADQRDFSNATVAAGMLAVPAFTDASNGDVVIGSAECLIHDNGNNEGNLLKFTITDATFSLTEGITTYIVVNYNGGSPEYQAITDVELINESNVIPVFTCYNENDTLVHKIHWNSLAEGTVNKLNMRFVKTDRFGHESGLSLGEDGVNRYVTITEGRVWTGAVRHELQAFDSNTDRWLFWSYDGTSWSKSVTTSGGTYNNTQYQSPTGLVSLGPSQYGVVWVFRDTDDDPHAGYVLGSDGYNSIAAAAEAPLPSLIPAEFAAHGILVGRIIVQEGENVAAQIDSAFEDPITNTPVTDHNNLSGITGDAPYYHADQSVSIAASPTFADATIAGEVFSSLYHPVQQVEITDDVAFNSIDSTTSITAATHVEAGTYVKGGELWTLQTGADGTTDISYNDKYMVDSSAGGHTYVTQGTPFQGQMFTIFDQEGTFNLNSVFVQIDHGSFEGVAAPNTVELDAGNSYNEFVYVGGSIGWKLISFVAS